MASDIGRSRSYSTWAFDYVGASVSVEQTDEMKQKNVQLVVPTPIQATYKPEQQRWLMSFKTFIKQFHG